MSLGRRRRRRPAEIFSAYRPLDHLVCFLETTSLRHSLTQLLQTFWAFIGCVPLRIGCIWPIFTFYEHPSVDVFVIVSSAPILDSWVAADYCCLSFGPCLRRGAFRSCSVTLRGRLHQDLVVCDGSGNKGLLLLRTETQAWSGSSTLCVAFKLLSYLYQT